MITTESAPEAYQTRFTNGRQTGMADTQGDKGGLGQGFRPHELLEAALASCMNITLRMAAEKHGIPLAGASVSVTLDRGPAGAVFRYQADLEGPLTEGQKKALRAALEGCPVRRTLGGGFGFSPVQDAR